MSILHNTFLHPSSHRRNEEREREAENVRGAEIVRGARIRNVGSNSTAPTFQKL